MTWRTSEVELCCSSASRSSRRRRAISVSRVEAERRRSTVLAALRRRFGADAARLRNLPVLPPALERRFIALSRPRTGHRSGSDQLPGSGPLRCRRLDCRMSALGQKQTSDWRWLMSALPPKTDMVRRGCDVRFVPKADIRQPIRSPRRLGRAASAEFPVRAPSLC